MCLASLEYRMVGRGVAAYMYKDNYFFFAGCTKTTMILGIPLLSAFGNAYKHYHFTLMKDDDVRSMEVRNKICAF